jgi:hypothetical protein
MSLIRNSDLPNWKGSALPSSINYERMGWEMRERKRYDLNAEEVSVDEDGVENKRWQMLWVIHAWVQGTARPHNERHWRGSEEERREEAASVL